MFVYIFLLYISSPSRGKIARDLYEHLKFSSSLLALFHASEKVYFTPEPICIALSSDLALDHTFIMQ